jgi:hypothetical protein
VLGSAVVAATWIWWFGWVLNYDTVYSSHGIRVQTWCGFRDCLLRVQAVDGNKTTALAWHDECEFVNAQSNLSDARATVSVEGSCGKVVAGYDFKSHQVMLPEDSHWYPVAMQSRSDFFFFHEKSGSGKLRRFELRDGKR